MDCGVPDGLSGRVSNQVFTVMASLISGFSKKSLLFRQQINAATPQHKNHEPEKPGREQAVHRQSQPEAPTIAQHPRQNEKHRQRGQHEPKGALGVVGQTLRRLAAVMHPQHRHQRGQRQRDEQGREAVVEKLNLGDHHDDRRADQQLNEIERRE